MDPQRAGQDDAGRCPARRPLKRVWLPSLAWVTATRVAGADRMVEFGGLDLAEPAVREQGGHQRIEQDRAWDDRITGKMAGAWSAGSDPGWVKRFRHIRGGACGVIGSWEAESHSLPPSEASTARQSSRIAGSLPKRCVAASPTTCSGRGRNAASIRSRNLAQDRCSVQAGGDGNREQVAVWFPPGRASGIRKTPSSTPAISSSLRVR